MPLVIFESDTHDLDRYIREVVLVTLKYGNDMFGDDLTFQKDGTMPDLHTKSQEWSANSFPSFIDKDHWSPNSTDLNSFDYYIWKKIEQVIKQNKVTSKKSLIIALKRAVKEISKDVVFESYLSGTNQLYRMSQDKGNYHR